MPQGGSLSTPGQRKGTTAPGVLREGSRSNKPPRALVSSGGSEGSLRKTEQERPAQSPLPQRRGLRGQQTNGSLLGFSYLVVRSLVCSSSFWMT